MATKVNKGQVIPDCSMFEVAFTLEDKPKSEVFAFTDATISLADALAEASSILREEWGFSVIMTGIKDLGIGYVIKDSDE